MKFLADENFPLLSSKILKENGIDILIIALSSPGISDKEILNLAIIEDRTILTFDRDFGQLIFMENFRPQAGVVYFRLESFKSSEPAEFLLRTLEEDIVDFRSTLTVIDKSSIRQRRFTKNP
jgi:predicted nuclease of predicted toxin-antitoxin system